MLEICFAYRFYCIEKHRKMIISCVSHFCHKNDEKGKQFSNHNFYVVASLISVLNTMLISLSSLKAINSFVCLLIEV